MYCSGVSQTSKRLESRSLELPHLGHSFRVGFLRFMLLSTSRRFLSMPMLFCPVSLLLNFNVFFWVSKFNKVGLHSLAVVSLEYNLIVFRGPSAGAEGFEFLGESS